MGSTISVQELSQTLSPTGKQYSFLTTSNLGTFTPNASFGSNLLSTSATGYYYDENLNAISAGPITLEAYSDLTADTVIDVNVLSTLAYQRISTLVAAGSSIEAARQQAEKEVLATFHIRNAESYPDFSQLDLSQTGNANNILAALSSVLDYGETSGNLASLVATFQSDIAGTGTMTDANTLATIAASSKSVVPATIAANLNTEYASESLALTATNISSWIDQDGDGVIGKFKFYQLNATPSTAYPSPQYTAGPDDDGTLASVSEGTLLVNGSAVSSSGAVVHNGDVLTIQLTSSANLDYPVTSYILSNGLKIARFTVTTTPLAVSTGSGIGNNGIPSGVQVTDDGNTLLLVSFDTCTGSGGGTCAAPSNGGLYTYSLATPSSPALEGHTYQVYSPYVWAGYYQVAYSSITHSAFVADSGAYLQSFNVSTPSSPTFESGAYVTCQGMSVVLSLDKSSAFITDSCGGVSQFDISNPNSMTLISSTSINSQARYTAISPDGQQLLLFNQGYVAVVDISTGKLGTVTVISQNSVLSGSTNGAQGFANGVYIGNRSIALVAPSGVSIFDVTTPSAPTIVGSLSFATQQASSGTVAYAATYVKSTGLTYLVANNTFYVLNASDPASPYIEGSATLQIGSGSSVGSDSASISTTSDGSIAYVVSQGMVNVVSIP
jgi:hypothetical protein